MRPFLVIYLLIIIGMGTSPLFGQVVQGYNLKLDQGPSNNQIYQRDSLGRCYVTFTGTYTGSEQLTLHRSTSPGYSSIDFKIGPTPISVKPDSTFRFSMPIDAELRDWDYSIYAGPHKLIEIENVTCGDVIAVLGQSNATSDLGGPEAPYSMNGFEFNLDYEDRYCRAMGQGLWGLEANRYPYSWKGWGPAGSIFYDGHHAGGWPLKLQHDLVQAHKIPIGIINAAFSGSKIEQHLKDADPIDTLYKDGVLIHDNPVGYNINQYFLSKLKRAGVREKLKYIIWYQGESDIENSGCEKYYLDMLEQLRSEWYDTLPSLQHIFTFQLNTSCLEGIRPNAYNLRETQRIFAKSHKDVHLVPTYGLTVSQMCDTEVIPDSEVNQPCHYNRMGMELLGDRIFSVFNFFAYLGSSTPPQMAVPNQLKSAVVDDQSNQLTLQFSYPLVENNQTDNPGGASLKDYFFDQNYEPIPAKSLTITGSTVTIDLKENKGLEQISLLPASFYHENKRTFYGPWLSSQAGYMTPPFIANCPVLHTSDEPPVFKRLWENSGLGFIANQSMGASDQFYTGNFTDTASDQILKIDETGEAQLFTFDETFWEARKSSSFKVDGSFCVLTGSFQTTVREQPVLIHQNGIEVYDLFDSAIFRYSCQPVMTALFVSGDFDGNGQDEILELNPQSNTITVLDIDNKELKKTIHRLHNGFQWQYMRSFTTGDFDGDGADELLASGEETVMMEYINDNWEFLWKADQINHLPGPAYPFNSDEYDIQVHDLDKAHPGDELVLISKDGSKPELALLGFNPHSLFWDRGTYPLEPTVVLGDWPLYPDESGNPRYFFLENKQGHHLWSLREASCGNQFTYDSDLYTFNFKMESLSAKTQYADLSKKFNLYPMPAESLLHIESNFENFKPLHLEIFSANGNFILSYTETLNPKNFLLETAKLKPGFYLITLSTGEVQEAQKLIIR